jgi:hypothetical protein
MFLQPWMLVKEFISKDKVPFDFTGFSDSKVAVVCAVRANQSKHSEIVKQRLKLFSDEEETVG